MEAVSGEGVPALPRPRSPYPDRGVVRPRNDRFAGGGEHDAGHLALVPSKHLEVSARQQFRAFPPISNKSENTTLDYSILDWPTTQAAASPSVRRTTRGWH